MLAGLVLATANLLQTFKLSGSWLCDVEHVEAQTSSCWPWTLNLHSFIYSLPTCFTINKTQNIPSSAGKQPWSNTLLLHCASVQLITVFYSSWQTASGALPPPTDPEYELTLSKTAFTNMFPNRAVSPRNSTKKLAFSTFTETCEQFSFTSLLVSH